jgi:DNA-binding FadR family transcriptional regulator
MISPQMSTLPRAEKVSYRLAKSILAEIKRDGLEPGDVLPLESEMLRSYGVSRGSLREALRILEIQGIIRVKPGPGGGPIIAETSSTDFGRAAALHFHVAGVTFDELIEARCLIEPELARRAANSIDDDGAEALREALALSWEVQHGPAPEWERASAEFHMLVAKLGNNKLLTLVNDALATVLDERVRLVIPVKDREAGYEAHKKIADAVIAGDGDRAAYLMRRHLEALTRRIAELQPGVLGETIEWR